MTKPGKKQSREPRERHCGKGPGCVWPKGEWVCGVSEMTDAQEPAERQPVWSESNHVLDLRRQGKKTRHQEEIFTQLNESEGKEEMSVMSQGALPEQWLLLAVSSESQCVSPMEGLLEWVRCWVRNKPEASSTHHEKW